MARASGNPASGPSVTDFIEQLAHPARAEIVALREIVLGVDASVSEAIKWNAPSFRTTEHFATMHLRARAGVQLILHLGAKKRELPAQAIADPGGLLTWLAPDRASLRVTSCDQLQRIRPALEAILRQWIAQV